MNVDELSPEVAKDMEIGRWSHAVVNNLRFQQFSIGKKIPPYFGFGLIGGRKLYLLQNLKKFPIIQDGDTIIVYSPELECAVAIRGKLLGVENITWKGILPVINVDGKKIIPHLSAKDVETGREHLDLIVPGVMIGLKDFVDKMLTVNVWISVRQKNLRRIQVKPKVLDETIFTGFSSYDKHEPDEWYIVKISSRGYGILGVEKVGIITAQKLEEYTNPIYKVIHCKWKAASLLYIKNFPTY